jgi:hypothetical protein
MAAFTLLAEELHGDCSYTVTIEESIPGLARLNIEAKSEGQNPDGFNNSQGVDLTGAECEAIGKHLIAVAERLRRSR